jgi:O-antigen ligase
MLPTRRDPALLPARIFALGGLACVAALTLIDRGATRQYATPWSLLLWFAQLAPFAVLLLRCSSFQTAFVLPSRTWCVAAAAFAAAVLASALASPFRGPSLLNALLPLAGLAAFFCLHDWLQQGDPAAQKSRLITLAGFAGAVIAVFSLTLWLADVFASPDGVHNLSTLLVHRNDRPLGHSNYTAGLALLALPWLGALVWRARGLRRAAWLVAIALTLAMLFTSGSRGGLVGLGTLALAALFTARLNWKKLLLWTAVALVAALALALAQPRTRATLFRKSAPATDLSLSTIQRSAMLTAGLHMGADRPLLGWGPGTTPLVFPRYRASLDGGVENALQLHSTPVQLWADLGLFGLAAALALLVLAACEFRGCRPAALALAAYAIFSLTDWQLDLPSFVFALAFCAALLASPQRCNPIGYTRPGRARLLLGACALVTLVLVSLFGRPDPAPALNIRALELARDPAQADRATALLRESLALNPDQEIAHFNLGWLLVTRDPAAAEPHFLAAARLVPDKGGVYFGLGLARLNARRPRAEIVRALALECLNDPLFLTSPWWREPSLHALQADTFATAAQFSEALAAARIADRPALLKELRYLAALTRWLSHQARPGEILGAANTSARVSYFARRPPLPDFATATVRQYRRERTGYPVLMRDLDLPVPVDLFDVQENALAAGEFAFLFPAKGWLPSPQILALLDGRLPPTD